MSDEPENQLESSVTDGADYDNLRTLYNADIDFIAQCKDRQWYVLGRVSSLAVIYSGIFVTSKHWPERMIGATSLLFEIFVLYSAWMIWSLHSAMRRKRARMWRVANTLGLGEFLGRSQRSYEDEFYDWPSWGPMLLLCALIAAFIAWTGWPFVVVVLFGSPDQSAPA